MFRLVSVTILNAFLGTEDDNEEMSTISQSAQKRRNRVPIRLLKALRDSSKVNINFGDQ